MDEEFPGSLPWDDDSIDVLDTHARRAIGAIWFDRARSELAVAAQFEAIRAGFARRGHSASLDAALASAVTDEARHARLCGAVAQRFGDVRRATTSVEVGPLVRFGDADEGVSLLLHLVLLSSINEVASTFYLRSAMKESSGKLASAVVRELLSDDVEHARLGFAHLASPNVDSEAKRHVGSALPTLLRLSYDIWANVPTTPKRGSPITAVLGAPSPARASSSPYGTSFCRVWPRSASTRDRVNAGFRRWSPHAKVSELLCRSRNPLRQHDDTAHDQRDLDDQNETSRIDAIYDAFSEVRTDE